MKLNVRNLKKIFKKKYEILFNEMCFFSFNNKLQSNFIK